MQLNYRPEIDGLRAIAVLAVLVYHAEFFVFGAQFFKAGYLGVDIFFVISGFLITSIILKELARDGSFVYGNFYERRARRILPALFIVILASFPFASYLLLPTQLTDFSNSIISTVFFGSNLYWQLSLQEYGAESALLKPFLHTWSLAIEEQYYIIFPAVLLAIYKRPKKVIVILLATTLILSLALSHYLSGQNQSLSFYMLPTRFWELLAGSLLAVFLYLYPRNDHNPFLLVIMPPLGMILIFLSLYFVDFGSNHPGAITLLPVIGTLLIIGYANQGDVVTKMLSSRFFVAIGLISYSLYLWHYPIFAFGRHLNFSPNWFDKAIWLLLTFILSAICYYLIEKPFRNSERVSSKRFWLAIVVSSIIILSVSGYYLSGIGKGQRIEQLAELYGKINPDNQALAKEAGALLEKMDDEWDVSSENQGATRLLILGNSHGYDTFNAIYQTDSLREIFQVRRMPFDNGRPISHYQNIFNHPLFVGADVILISTRYVYDPDIIHQTRHVMGLDTFVKAVVARGKPVAIASNSLEFEAIDNKPIFDWLVIQGQRPTDLDLKKLYFEKLDSSVLAVNSYIEEVARVNQVPFLDKSEYMCDVGNQECDVLTPDGYKIFYDRHHYTLKGAQHFGRKMVEIGWLEPLMSAPGN